VITTYHLINIIVKYCPKHPLFEFYLKHNFSNYLLFSQLMSIMVLHNREAVNANQA